VSQRGGNQCLTTFVRIIKKFGRRGDILGNVKIACEGALHLPRRGTLVILGKMEIILRDVTKELNSTLNET
jgi:hypothetical protein